MNRATRVARAAQHSRQPICQVRATTPTGDPRGAERVRIGGPRLTPAASSRSSLAACQRTITPRRTRRQPDASRTDAPPTSTAAPRPNGRLARSEPSRTCRILADRHLGSNRWPRRASTIALRSRGRVYRNCEDPRPGAQPGVCSTAASREVWSALGRAMRPPDLTRPPTSSRRRSAIVRRRLRHARQRGTRRQSACTVLGRTLIRYRGRPKPSPGSPGSGSTCAAILAGSIIAQLEGHPWATVLTASSGTRPAGTHRPRSSAQAARFTTARPT